MDVTAQTPDGFRYILGVMVAVYKAPNPGCDDSPSRLHRYDLHGWARGVVYHRCLRNGHLRYEPRGRPKRWWVRLAFWESHRAERVRYREGRHRVRVARSVASLLVLQRFLPVDVVWFIVGLAHWDL